MPRKRLELSAEENDVLEATREPLTGLASFLDYFTVADDTGTYISAAEDDYYHDSMTAYTGGQETMYPYLLDRWLRGSRPSYFYADTPYWAQYYLPTVQWRVTLDDQNEPIFHWRHGWLPLEWGSRMHFASQSQHTILGGFGCSKTAHVGMSAFTMCATIPRFRVVATAPVLSQVKPMFQLIKENVMDTRAEKFIAVSRGGELMWGESPTPNIQFVNGSQMIFLGADKDITKVRSAEGDWVIIEQSETHSNLSEVTMELGTRSRGRTRGRKRLGRMTFIANSGDSPELWQRFDAAEVEPQHYFSFNMSTYENPHLTREDIWKMEMACGNDPDTIDQFMRGYKPVGRGEEFPPSVIHLCESEALDNVMQRLLSARDVNATVREERGVGVTYWSLPPGPAREYMVWGDPGTKNPPYRGAGVVMVFDVTDFPSADAELVHFHWVAGNNRIGPFLDAFQEAVEKFNAQAAAFYDNTGDQKNINELAFEERGLLVYGINSSSIKGAMMAKTLRLMEKGLLRWAKGIAGIAQQLTKYRREEDKKLAQDIVMVLLMVGHTLAPKLIAREHLERQQKPQPTWRSMIRQAQQPAPDRFHHTPRLVRSRRGTRRH